jgi:single-strand DNA-binding protein
VAGSINTVVLVGNLTRDPELKALPSGNSVCSMRIAVNDRVKDPTTGEWTDKPNYLSVDVFGQQAENCARFLAKGRQVAIEGRLRWREWETQEGQKREAVSVVANTVQFIGPREPDAGGGPGNYPGASGGPGATFDNTGLSPNETDFKNSDDDDIPF